MLAPDMLNILTPDFIRVWLWAAEAGRTLELYPEAADCGGWPDWYEHDIKEGGWDLVLGVGWCGGETLNSEQHWLLEKGIAPYQPFQVEVPRPHYYRSGGYTGPEEWDVVYSWSLLQVRPWKPASVARIWERTLKQAQADRDAIEEHRRRTKELQRTDVAAMSLVRRIFCTRDCYYDSPCTCRGVRVHLKSDHPKPGGALLIAGEDRGGDWEKARAILFQRAMAQLGLSPQQLGVLPTRKGFI